MLYFDVEADWKKFQDLRLEITRLEKALNDINVNRSVSETVKLENQLAAARGEMEKMAKTAAVAGYDMEKGMERSLAAQNQLLQDYNSKLIEHRKNLLAAQQTMKDIKQEATEKISIFGTNGKLDRDATAKARQQYISKNAGDAPEVIERETAAIEKLRGEREKLNISIQRSRTEYDLLMKEQQRLTSSAQSVSAGITKFAAALGGAKLIKDFGQRMVQTRAQFQSMEAALNTMVGSDKAGQLMTELKDLAKQSPLTMQSMVAAEKTMLGFGLSADKTTKYIKAISDVSMGDAGRFNALTLAFSQMSAAGRLMGQDLLQMINAGFNPLEQMSRTTGKSIAQLKDEMSKGAISAEMVQKAFMDATQAGGKFAGMSEATAKTINGQMSMLNDALDNMFNELGKSAEGFIVSGISKITGLVQSYEEIVPALEAAVAALGMAKVASLAYIKVQEQSAIAAKIYGVSVESATMKQKLSIAATNAAKKAQLALNAAMKAAPWALAAAAVGALVYAAIKYNQKQKEIHAGETRMAEAMAKTAQKTQAEQIKASLLTSELGKLTEGTDEYNAKKKELVDYAATYDRKLADEIANTTDLTTCYDKLAEAIDKANKKKMAAEFYTSESAQIEQNIANFDTEYREKVAKWYTNDVKNTDVKEYTKRYLEVERMFKEIQTGLKEGTISFDLETNQLKGLSKETMTLIHDMQMSWDGGDRLIEGIRTVAKTVSVSRAVINEVMDNTGTSYAVLAKDVKNDIDKAQKEIEDSAADIKKNFDKKSVENLESAAKGKKDAIERLRDELKNLLADAQKNGAKADDIKLIQSYLNAMVTETDESGNEFTVTLEQHLDNLINKFQSQIAKIEGQTLDEARKRAHAEWEKAKKELQDAKTLKEYNDAKAKVDATQKSYYALGGDEIEKQKEAQKKFDEELAKMRSDSDKKKLQAKKDSIEKELQLIDFEYQEKLKEYEKQEKELAEKLKKKQITKAQYNSAMGIIGEQRTQAKDDTERRKNDTRANYKSETQILLDQYKTYDEERKALDLKYQGELRKMIEVGDGEKLKLFKEQYEKLYDELDEKFGKTVLKTSAPLAAAMENASNQTKKSLKESLKVLQAVSKYKKTQKKEDLEGSGVTTEEADKINLEQLKLIYDQLIVLQDEYDKKSNYPFRNLVEGFKALDKAKKAETNGDKTEQIKQEARAQQMFSAAVDETAQSFSTLGQMMQDIGEGSGNTKIKELGETFSQVGTLIGNIASGFKSGSYWGAIISGVTTLVSMASQGASKVAQANAQMEQSYYAFARAVRQANLEIKQEDYSSMFGTDKIKQAELAMQSYQDSMQKYQEIVSKGSGKTRFDIQNEFDKYDARFKKGGQLNTEGVQSLEKFVKGELTEIQAITFQTYEASWRERNALLKKNRRTNEFTTLADFRLENGEGVFDENGILNVENARLFLETTNYLDEKQRDLLQNAIDYADAMEKAKNTMDEIAGDIIGQMASGMTNAIQDAVLNGADAFSAFEKTGADAIKNLGDLLLQELLITDWLDSYKEDLSEAVGNGDWDKINEIMGQIGAEMPEKYEQGMKAVDTLYKAAEAKGVNMSTLMDGAKQQSAVAGAFQTMSEDTAGVLEGRFTAVYESNLAIQGILLNAQQNITNEMKIYESIASESRGIMAESLLHLQSISASNEEIHKLCKTINGNVDDIRTSTKKMAG